MTAYQGVGCDEFIVPAFTFSSLGQAIDTCDLFMTEVAAGFR